MFKKLVVFTFVMIAFTGIFISCSDDDDSSSGPDTTAPTVWVAAPADSAEVISGLTLMITAGVSDNKGVTKVEFYVDSIINWIDSIPSTFSYEFNTVGREVGDYEIFLKAYDAAGNVGVSESTTITITPTQTLTVTSPNGNEKWNVGTTQNISWNVNTVDTLVKIELIRPGAVVSVLSGSTENNGIFTWLLPTDLTPASDYMIRITGLQTTVSDVSNSGFIITNEPFIQVMSPNGGEDWAMLSTQTITWQDNLTEDIKIELFRGSATVPELSIVDSVASNGSYLWTVPNTLAAGSNYKIKITSIPVNSVFDGSDATFSISAK